MFNSYSLTHQASLNDQIKFQLQFIQAWLYFLGSIYLRNFDSVSKNHNLGMYVYVMEAYTI